LNRTVFGKRGWVLGLAPAVVITRDDSAESFQSLERTAYDLGVRADVDIAI
jgi:hypothetical protein